MALRFPDTAVPMGDFPAAMAEHIEFSDGENLQEKLDNEALGGKQPMELTYEEYKQLEADGLVEDDRDYVIVSDENGILLTSTDVAYSDTLTVKGKFDEVDETIEELKSDVQDIATELKTSSNTDVINIAGTDYINTSSMVNRYQVVNGICYVTIEFQALQTKSLWDGVSSFFETVLPKPKVQVDIFYDGTQRLLLGNSGLVYGDITIDKRVYASFSYPVA